jgi:hypothetical protein
MAGDNAAGLNQQYSTPGALFGGGTAGYASTGAPGSSVLPDASPDVMSGPVIASPAISTPYASSQIPANMPHVGVTAGDTSGMSSDNVVPPRGDPLTGLTQAQLTQTGAGMGSDITEGHHPNSMARRP